MWRQLLNICGLGCGTPWTCPYWAPIQYTGHRPKRGGASPRQILVINLFCELPSTPNSYVPEFGGIGKVMKLFQLYKDLLKRTPYAVVVSFLVKTASGIRKGNEVQAEDDSDFNVYIFDVVMSSSRSIPVSWLL